MKATIDPLESTKHAFVMHIVLFSHCLSMHCDFADGDSISAIVNFANPGMQSHRIAVRMLT